MDYMYYYGLCKKEEKNRKSSFIFSKWFNVNLISVISIQWK